MQLQKQVSRRIGKTEYHKYVLAIPPKLVRKAKWRKGATFTAKKSGKRIVLYQK